MPPHHTPKNVSNLKGSPALRKLRIGYYMFHITTIVIGVGLIVVSRLAQNVETETIHMLELHITRGISITAYVTAALSIVSGGIGLAALYYDKKPYLWIIYCILMAILTLLSFSGAVSSSKQGSSLIKKEMHSLMSDYHFNIKNANETTTSKVIKVDAFQKKYNCCGVDSYSDWQDVEFGRTSLRLPTSCCFNTSDPECGELCLPSHVNLTQTIHVDGCFKKMTLELDGAILKLTIVGILLCIIALILFILSCYLVISKKA